MNCEQMTALLSAFLDGELTAREETQAREHLEQCAQCRALLEQLQTLHTSFSDLEELPAPENFAQGVMSRIKAEEKPKVIPLFKRPQVRTVMGLAACAVLCIGFGRVALDGGYKLADMNSAAAPEAAVAESGVLAAEDHAVTQFTSGAGSFRMDNSPAQQAAPEAAEPEMPAAPAMIEPAEAPAEMQMAAQNDGAAAEKFRAEAEMILSELPEGFEAAVGPLQWEERIEDGALCVQLTAEQTELLVEMAGEQGLSFEQTIPDEGENVFWTLVLAP